MSQFITIQVGQCGNQIGSTFWPSALEEYGIETPTSGPRNLRTQRNYLKNVDDLSDAFHSFFHIPNGDCDFRFTTIADINKANVKARTILVDMEDSVVARYKAGPLRGLFDQTCMITNYPGSGNNWAMGYYSHGTAYQSKLEECIQRAIEKCDCLHGFLMLHSVGGGTGSGLGSAIIRLLAENYPEIDRLVCPIYPTATEDVVTCPYNVLLTTEKLIEHATAVFPVENRSLLDICEMEQINYNVTCEPFQDMNSIVTNMLLHLTSGSRFPGNLNLDMNEISTNLSPYPKLQYICSSVSPPAITSTVSSNCQSKIHDEIFRNAWSRDRQLVKIDPLQSASVILGAAYVARGNWSMTHVKRNIERFQSKTNFTVWGKEATKVGLCSIPAAGHSTSLLCLLNSSAMVSLFKNIVSRFITLYRSKAHVHHYTKVSGFEDSQFLDSKEIITDMCAQYNEVQTQNNCHVTRLEIV